MYVTQANAQLYSNISTFKSDCRILDEETGEFYYGCGTYNVSIMAPTYFFNSLLRHLNVTQQNVKAK